MSDLFLKLSANPQAKKVIKALGLPIPTPEILARAQGPRRADELAGKAVWLSGHSGLSGALKAALEGAGAQVSLTPPAEGERLHAVIIDGSQAASAQDLRALLEVGQPGSKALLRCGRVLVVARAGVESATMAAAQGALEGFTRSLAKELGRRGCTANLLRVAPGGEAHLDAPVRFFLSARSAYVTGQPLDVRPGAQAPQGPQLSGRVVVVTGGGRGIGEATARCLAAEGARVLVVERPADLALAEAVAASVGGRALGIDVADPAAGDALAAALRDEGGAHAVVHNAGITRDKTLGKMAAEHWDPVLAINFTAVVGLTQRLLSDGLINPGGRIVGLSSIAGLAGNAGQTNYAATKCGVAAWVRHLGPSLAEAGITANAVAPGFIETRMTESIPFAIREVARRMNSLGQGGQPQDVAEAITFLTLPAASGVTGQVLRVCGGALIGA